MEDKSQANPPENTIVNRPVVQAENFSTNKNNILFPLLITFLVTAVVFGLSGYYIGNKSQPLKSIEQTTPTPISERNDEIIIPSSASTETTNKINLSEALSQFCLNSKISLNKLPFTLDQSIKTAYGVQNSINCFVPDENYANMSIRVENPEFSGDIRNVYFFHQNSKYMGMGDNFQSLSNYKTVMINGQSYWLNVREPGPYGISSLGVWIDLIGEKRDASSGTIVRVMNLDILKDQQFVDLVKKYGSQSSTVDGNPLYVVNSTEKTQFIDEVVKLAPQNNALKVSAQNISSDLNDVSF
ncbi:MAG: hypothetical protein PVJ09_01510 [Candidatus Woesebacteria bacterium]|jgi:hypothetical protein